MRNNRVNLIWLLVLVIASSGILTACTSGDTPVVGNTGVYLQTEFLSMSTETEGFGYKCVYNADGTLRSYERQSIEEGETASAEITYEWANGLITGATLNIPSGQIPVRYDYSAANPTVLESITITDKDSPCWLEAACDTQGRVVKLDLGHYGDKDAFWTYTYTYGDSSVRMESYCYGELDHQQTYDYDGNVLEDTIYMEGNLHNRTVYTYDANGSKDSVEYYDADNELLKRQTYKNNDQGLAVESDVFDSSGVLKAHYTLSYDERGQMTEQNIYDGEGNLLKTLKNQYTYDNDKLTAVQQRHIEGDTEQTVDFVVTHEAETATVVTQAMEGEYFAKSFTAGAIAAKYTVDGSGELIAKETFNPDGSLADRHRYEKVPVSSENKWQEVDPKMLIDVLFWFY